jgi:hypothetical protein
MVIQQSNITKRKYLQTNNSNINNDRTKLFDFEKYLPIKSLTDQNNLLLRTNKINEIVEIVKD